MKINRDRNRRGKLFIFRVYLFLGDTVNIGEAALGICFPLKAFSSYPMHPVPHLSMFYMTRTRDVDIKKS
jgi:hypothetical protein